MSQSYGIGQVGLGGITTFHRQGYQRFDQPYIGGYDPAPEAVQRMQSDTPGAKAYDSLEELLADPQVGVIDLATPHHAATRLPVIKTIAAAGKPVLIQKPLGYTYDDALTIVETLEQAGVVGMVNQNMCFTPGSLDLIDVVMRQRQIGDPGFAQVSVQYRFDTRDHPWFGKDDRWWTGALTVHHFGLLQLLFGPPETVFAVTGHDPQQPGVTSDGYGHLLLRYPSGMAVAVTSTGTYFGTDPVPHGNEKIWIQGDAGIVDWRPEGGLTLSRRAGEQIDRTELPARAAWFPNAFGLTMVHLRQALAAGQTPLCSVQDNLYVAALIEAAYRSAGSGQAVQLKTIMGDRYDPDYGTGWQHGFTGWTPPATEPEQESAP